jgi:hypothetical protein
VSEKIAEIDRIGRVKRFLPPQIAQLVTTSGHEGLLESHLFGYALFDEPAAFRPRRR